MDHVFNTYQYIICIIVYTNDRDRLCTRYQIRLLVTGRRLDDVMENGSFIVTLLVDFRLVHAEGVILLFSKPRG